MEVKKPLTGGAPTALAKLSNVLFDQTWSANVFGAPASIELRITKDGDLFVFHVMARVAGMPVSAGIPVSGDVTVPIGLPLVGTLNLEVRNWQLAPNQLAFDLTLAIAPPFPFFPPITVASVPVRIPLLAHGGLAGGAAAPQSPSELLAMLQLLNVGNASAMPPRPRPPRPAGGRPPGTRPPSPSGGEEIVELDSGFIWFGPNWRESRLIEPKMAFGAERRGDPVVYMAPGGNGHAYFERWLNPDDERDARFYLHMGSPFWFGGGTAVWVLNGAYQVDQPF